MQLGFVIKLFIYFWNLDCKCCRQREATLFGVRSSVVYGLPPPLSELFLNFHYAWGIACINKYDFIKKEFKYYIICVCIYSCLNFMNPLGIVLIF